MTRGRILGWGLAAALLGALWLATRVSDAMAWDGADFAMLAAMLLLFGGAFELVLRFTGRRRTRLVAGAVLAAGFVLVWADAAVGVF